MKRDMDLVRAILLAVEARPPQTIANPNAPSEHLQIEGYDDLVVTQHVELLEQANLVTAGYIRADGVGNVYARHVRLTWLGHEFLDAARNDVVWEKTKAIVREKGGSASFAVIQSLLVEGAKKLFGL